MEKKKQSFCPTCKIGLSKEEVSMGFCCNCKDCYDAECNECDWKGGRSDMEQAEDADDVDKCPICGTDDIYYLR